jgi:hypothetical protein
LKDHINQKEPVLMKDIADEDQCIRAKQRKEMRRKGRVY